MDLSQNPVSRLGPLRPSYSVGTSGWIADDPICTASISGKIGAKMNDAQRQILSSIKSLDSREAALWISRRLQEIDEGSPNAIEERDLVKILPRYSWRRKEHKMLGAAFLTNLPHQSDVVYRALLSFMSLSVFLDCLKCCIQDCSKEDRKLIKYYLEPLLISKAKSQKELEQIDAVLE